MFTHDKSIITQREIGTDTASFPDALRAALRQDPDVIMVGEMRDLETVDTSLKAAETGHLVFSTIHTADVASTINRLVSFFPTEEHQVRARLADNLKAIVSLRLLVNKKQTAGCPPSSHAFHAVDPGVHQGSRQDARDHRVHRARPRRADADLRSASARPASSANKISIEDRPGSRLEPGGLPDEARMEGSEDEPEAGRAQAGGPFEIDSDERF